MREADDLLVAMEAKASKLINTDGLKSLFQWVERITDTPDTPNSGYPQQAFAISQYLILNEQNKCHENVKDKTEKSQDFYILGAFYSLSADFYRSISQIYGDISSTVNIFKDLYSYGDLYPDLYLYCDQVNTFSADLFSYYDFYRYVDAAFHSSNFSEFGEKFDRELSKRIKIVMYIKERKIFEGVNLQRMVQRFNKEREFIKAAGEGKSVEPLAKSIHDTWISVLGITPEMLAIPREAKN